jgi:hypothetical protein
LEVASFDRPGVEVSQVHLAAHYVTWVEAAPGHMNSRVMLYDLTSKTITPLASAPAGGEVDSPRLLGEGDGYVTYTELSRIPSDADHRSAWRLILLNLRSRRAVSLAAKPEGEFVEQIPGGRLVGHWCIWAQADSTSDLGSRSIFAHDVHTGTVHRVAHGVHPSGDVSGWNDIVVYDDVIPGGGRNVVQQLINGGPRTVLTTSGHAILSVGANGAVTWQEPEDGAPTSEWYARLGRQPLRVASSHLGNAVPGAHIAVWLSDEYQLWVRSVDSDASLVLQAENLNIGGRWWVDGDTVVWSTLSGEGTATIHVAAVTSPS